MKNKISFAFSILFLALAASTPFASVGAGERAVTILCCLLAASIYFVRAFSNR